MTRNAPDVKITPIWASAIARSPGSRATAAAPAVAVRNHDTPYAERLVASGPASRDSSGRGRSGSGRMTRKLTRYVAAWAGDAARQRPRYLPDRGGDSEERVRGEQVIGLDDPCRERAACRAAQ